MPSTSAANASAINNATQLEAFFDELHVLFNEAARQADHPFRGRATEATREVFGLMNKFRDAVCPETLTFILFQVYEAAKFKREIDWPVIKNAEVEVATRKVINYDYIVTDSIKDGCGIGETNHLCGGTSCGR